MASNPQCVIRRRLYSIHGGQTINDCKILQGCLLSITRWENAWQMQLDVKKCNAISITHKSAACLRLQHEQFHPRACQYLVPHLGWLLPTICHSLTTFIKWWCKTNRKLGLLRCNFWRLCNSEIAYSVSMLAQYRTRTSKAKSTTLRCSSVA